MAGATTPGASGPAQIYYDPQTGRPYYIQNPTEDNFASNIFNAIGADKGWAQLNQKVYLDNFGFQPAQMAQQLARQYEAVSSPFAEAINMQGGAGMPMGNAGVSQFLTGNLAIPMQFGVDLPAYESTPFSPGDFAAFMAAQSQGTAKKPIIPVFNPATGTYSGVQTRGTP